MIRCSSVIGIAREVAAYFNLPLRKPETSLPANGQPIKGKAGIQITDPDLNPRFVLGLLTGRKSPAQPIPGSMPAAAGRHAPDQ